MKAHSLTAPQQTQAATNKAAVATARVALTAAVNAEQAYLRTASSAAANAKVSLSDDGTMVITG